MAFSTRPFPGSLSFNKGLGIPSLLSNKPLKIEIMARKTITLYDYQKDILATAITHEIAHTAKLKADAAEIGVGPSKFDDRLFHLRRLLDEITED